MREIGLTTNATTLATEERYRRMLKEWDQSGDLAATVAARHGVAAGTLRWWRSELKRRDRDRSSAPGNATAPVLLPVRVTSPLSSPTSSSSFEVALRGGRRVVRIPAGSDPAEVRALIDAIEGGPC